MPSSVQHSETIAIAGAGLLGRLLAWRLLEAGRCVHLYDAGALAQSASAAYTAAGMISPVSEAIDTEPLMYDLGMASLALWPQWVSDLSEATSAIDYANRGSVIVAHSRDQTLLRQYQQDMQRQLPAQAKAEVLDKAQLLALESDLHNGFQQALFFPQEAHIDNRQLLDALSQRIAQLGGKCIEHTKVELKPNCVIHNGLSHRYSCVLDCRGVGSKQQWRGVRGVRGEVLRVHTDEVCLTRPVRLLHPRYQLYVVPRQNQQFVIGATQIESEDNSPVSVQSALELNSALYAINPAFAEARIMEMQANLRPALNDNRPCIRHQSGLIQVNGLYRHGYLLAPTVVEHTLALLDQNFCPEQNFSDVLYQSIEEACDANLIA